MTWVRSVIVGHGHRAATIASEYMRGLTKTFAMLGLAGGLAIVPAIGSQGAGALGERHAHVDSHLLSAPGAIASLEIADRAVEAHVLNLTRRQDR